MYKLLLIMLLTLNALHAFNYNQEDLRQDMQHMSDAMHKIQAGFLYHNVNLVGEGTGLLYNTVHRVRIPTEDEKETDPIERLMNSKCHMTNKIAKKIGNRAKTLLSRFQEGDVLQATQTFDKIMRDCMDCHIQYKKW